MHASLVTNYQPRQQTARPVQQTTPLHLNQHQLSHYYDYQQQAATDQSALTASGQDGVCLVLGLRRSAGPDVATDEDGQEVHGRNEAAGPAGLVSTLAPSCGQREPDPLVPIDQQQQRGNEQERTMHFLDVHSDSIGRMVTYESGQDHTQDHYRYAATNETVAVEPTYQALERQEVKEVEEESRKQQQQQ